MDSSRLPRTLAARSFDLTRTVFQLLVLGVMIATTIWILRPFLVAAAWATTIVVSTWPLLARAQAWLGGRRALAVALMTLALLLIIVIPLSLAIMTIADHTGQIVGWSQSLGTLTLPPAPAWVEALPLVGPKLATRWHQLAAAGPEAVAALLAPYASVFVLWLVSQVGSIGLLLIDSLLTVILAGILYSTGEAVARGVDRFARRLAGWRGENAVHLAALAIRAVALGVVVTAIVQATLAGIGLALAGVPFATVLTVVMFILGVAQIGPMPVLIPAVIWVYARSGGAWGTGFLVWAIVCGILDNLMRPVLIKRGANLPLLLIFAGVVGGLIAFGIIGLFIGPVVLAVAYTLLVDWVSRADPDEPESAPSATDKHAREQVDAPAVGTPRPGP
jgi:predicted PurR-regulated permease PerM